MENTERRIFYVEVDNTDLDSTKTYMEHLFFEFKNKDIEHGIEPNKS